MPKLPIIIAESNIPSRVPYGQADPNVYSQGWDQVARGAEKLGKTSQEWFGTAMALLNERDKVETAIESSDALTKFMSGLPDLDVKLRENGYDHNTHPTRLRAAGQGLINDIARQMKNPRASLKFKLDATRTLGEKVSQETYASHKYAGKLVDVKNQEIWRTAIPRAAEQVDPKMREWYLFLATQDTMRAQELGSIDPDEAHRRIVKGREAVAMSLAREQINNDPETALDELLGLRPAKDKPTRLSAEDEAEFQSWYAGWAKKAQIDPDPDNPDHQYDYRAAWKSNAQPALDPKDGRYHFDSRFKMQGHANRVIDGIDTKTGKPVEREGPKHIFEDLTEQGRYTAIDMASKAIRAKNSAENTERARKEHRMRLNAQGFVNDALQSLNPTTAPDKRKLTNEEILEGIDFFRQFLSAEATTQLRRIIDTPLIAGGVDIPGVKAKLNLQIVSKDKSVTMATILSKVGHGISMDTASELIDKLQTEQNNKGVTSTEEYRQGYRHITILLTGTDPGGALGAPIIAAAMDEQSRNTYSDVLSRFYKIARQRYENPAKYGTIDDLADIAIKMAKNAKGGGTGTTSGSSSSSGSSSGSSSPSQNSPLKNSPNSGQRFQQKYDQQQKQ